MILWICTFTVSSCLLSKFNSLLIFNTKASNKSSQLSVHCFSDQKQWLPLARRYIQSAQCNYHWCCLPPCVLQNLCTSWVFASASSYPTIYHEFSNSVQQTSSSTQGALPNVRWKMERTIPNPQSEINVHLHTCRHFWFYLI